MATDRKLYIVSQTFFDADRWAAHDKVGELMAQGVSQITISYEHDEWTVSWPHRRPPNPLVTDRGIAA